MTNLNMPDNPVPGRSRMPGMNEGQNMMDLGLTTIEFCLCIICIIAEMLCVEFYVLLKVLSAGHAAVEDLVRFVRTLSGEII